MQNRCTVSACLLVVAITSIVYTTASGQTTSTPEERMQWVEVTHKLEKKQLVDSAYKQGEAAFKRMSDVHDFHVLLCSALLTEFNGMKYAYAHTVTRQYMMASGAFQIENSDKAADRKETALAALESVLKTYQAICSKNRTQRRNLSMTFSKSRAKGS